MFMASFKPVYLFIILLCFIKHISTKASDNNFVPSSCFGDETTPNSTFQVNVRILLSYLSSNATANKDFYSATIAGTNRSDTVYGMFMCRGDVPAQLCSQCVTNATQSHIVFSNPVCSLSKDVFIRYKECMVRYTNRYFFSTVDFSSASSVCSFSRSNKASFKRLVSETMNILADKAANFSIGVKKYATMETRISQFQTLYSQAQCTPYLSRQDCRRCLNFTMAFINERTCEGCTAANSEASSCHIKYDVHPFYRSITAPPYHYSFLQLLPTT